jgi:hypothetical protein
MRIISSVNGAGATPRLDLCDYACGERKFIGDRCDVANRMHHFAYIQWRFLFQYSAMCSELLQVVPHRKRDDSLIIYTQTFIYLPCTGLAPTGGDMWIPWAALVEIEASWTS